MASFLCSHSLLLLSFHCLFIYSAQYIIRNLLMGVLPSRPTTTTSEGKKNNESPSMYRCCDNGDEPRRKQEEDTFLFAVQFIINLPVAAAHGSASVNDCEQRV